MRRVILAVAVAAFAGGFGGPASAVCAGNLACVVDGCQGTVNVCPTAQACSGGVSVCPMAHPDDCHSNVDVCLDFVGPMIDCDLPKGLCPST